MSARLAPGLMRLNPHGEIVPCNYDFEIKRMGHITVTLPMVFTEEFNPVVSRWTRHELWKALVSTDEALGVLIVNNTFLITILASHLFIQRKVELQRPQIAAADTKLAFRPTRPVGFVRTYPEVKDVNVPPYRLFMDAHGRVSLGGGEPQALKGAVVSKDLRLYKSLITTNRAAIYMSVDGPTFL